MSLGLVVHLGHGGAACPAPLGEARVLHVVHTSGIQDAKFAFCGCFKTCVDDNNTYLQLFRARLFPATHQRPRTVVTFACLNDAHLLGNQGKLTASDYYLTLVRLSDNTDLNPPKVSFSVKLRPRNDPDTSYQRKFEEFARVLRLWRHLKLLKRAGVVFVSGGVTSAPAGTCALNCLACPDTTYDEDDIDAVALVREDPIVEELVLTGTGNASPNPTATQDNPRDDGHRDQRDQPGDTRTTPPDTAHDRPRNARLRRFVLVTDDWIAAEIDLQSC